ncbi:MAG: hypothetical protein KGJ62_04815 [Armatimonadetes bacterium]|nr:hypothetical protein [Armatimonadota bacterium]MDE2205382.1 hypothetical protein [Armatimonadota bacterium]
MRRITNAHPIALLVFLLAAALSSPCSMAIPPLYPVSLIPGQPAEASAIVKNSATTLSGSLRVFPAGAFAVYALPASRGSDCSLTLNATAAGLSAAPLDPNGKPLPSTSSHVGGAETTTWRMPAGWTGAAVEVMVSAKSGAANMSSLLYSQTLASTVHPGLPDSVPEFLLQGLTDHPPIHVVRRPASPVTVTQTPQAAAPQIDLQTDAVFAYTDDPLVIGSWKERGYRVWTMGGSRANGAFAKAHPGGVQRSANGQPLHIADSYYVTPTPARSAAESSAFISALDAGSQGVCLEEPEYWASAGYEADFKAAFRAMTGQAWQDPASSAAARWAAGQTMAKLEAAHIGDVLSSVENHAPTAKRLVAFHSPLNYAMWGIVCPQAAIAQLPQVQQVVGQVWTGTARTPVPYAGIRRDRTFSLAWLEYSSLAQLMRGTGKKLWFLMDPVEDDPARTMQDYRSHYEETAAAALMFPSVNAWEVMPWPERVYGRIPPDYALEVDSVVAALQQIGDSQAETQSSGPPGIGAFTSDTMQWQRGPGSGDSLDGFFGLTLPLLRRGVPVQALSLDRVTSPGYLAGYKTLLLSFDYQKPLSAATDQALASWVRNGGSLVLFGGSDPFNAVPGSWWLGAGATTPGQSLLQACGVGDAGAPHTVNGPAELGRQYAPVLVAPSGSLTGNRLNRSVDISSECSKGGSVALNFSTGSSGQPPVQLYSLELHINGALAAAFVVGTDLENRFIEYDNGSSIAEGARTVAGSGNWTYRFDNIPAGAHVTLRLDIAGGFSVGAASVQPDLGHTLLAAGPDDPLARAFPRLRIGATWPATLYSGIDHNTNHTSGCLYTLRSGGSVIWMQRFGKGAVINVGVPAAFFSSSERAAGLLRALTQYAYQLAGGDYSEPGALRVQRGQFTAIHAWARGVHVSDPTIDLFSPTLAVADTRDLPAHSTALLCQLSTHPTIPHINFISGRTVATMESTDRTGMYVRGPRGVDGAARISAAGRTPIGARGVDMLGRQIPVQLIQDDGSRSVLVVWPNDPDGVVVRVSWR